MHRLARNLTAAGCSTTKSAAWLAANSLHRAAVRTPPPARFSSSPRRAIHVRVPLPYNVEDGMGDFLSPAALRVVAEDYQQGLLDRLNEQIKGTNLENLSVAQIVISTAPHESQTLAFNYASLALNNSFFLHHLKPPTADSRNHEAALNEKYPYLNPEQMTLGGVIASQMGSLQDLKTYVTAAATGMLSSNGFVWLVTDPTGNLGVLATYGAGTLLVDERLQTFSPYSSIELGGMYVPAENLAAASPEQPEAPPAPKSIASGLGPPPLRNELPAGARALSTSALVRSTVGGGVGRPANVWSDAASAALRTGRGGFRGSQDGLDSLDKLGQTLFPLFCVSVHEHAWMAGGYGVWGREAYLERFWSCLDWAAVRDAYARYRQRQQKH